MGSRFRIWDIMKLRWALSYHRVMFTAFNRSFSIWSKILDVMVSSPYQWNGKVIRSKGSYSVKVTQEEGKILQCVLILQGFQCIEYDILFDYTHRRVSGPKTGDYIISWKSLDSPRGYRYSVFMISSLDFQNMYWERYEADHCIEFNELDSGITLPESYKGWETGLKYGI